MLTLLLLGSLFLSPPARDTLDIQIQGVQNPVITLYLREQVQAVISQLPEGFLTALLPDNQISLVVKSLNESLQPADICTSNDKTFGLLHKKSRRISLSSKLVALAFEASASGADKIDCQHQSIERTLRATLIHELAHVYDKKHKFSNRAEFRALASGPLKRSIFRKKHIRNYNTVSSPDPYEFINIKESFATNFEYYVLDPGFKCQKPAFTAIFDNVFGDVEDQQKSSSCEPFEKVLLHSHMPAENLSRVASLSPSEVYEIHYLHASKGKHMASRWGHAMIRIVTCAPHREEIGAHCLEDAAHHLVLSFRANISDLTISHFRGLTGAYPSQLFIYELPEIIKEYTRLEFRDLLSIPLALSREEIALFIKSTLERYWNYQGKYFFLSNHCGTETLNQLRIVKPQDVGTIKAKSPRRMLKTLPKSQLVEAAAYQSIVASATPSAYLFPSKRSNYQTALEELQGYGLFQKKSLDDMLNASNATARSSAYQNLFEQDVYMTAQANEKTRLLSSLLFIERLIQTKSHKAMTTEITRQLINDKSPLVDTLRTELERFYDKPWKLVERDSYGIPDSQSLDTYLSGVDHLHRQEYFETVEKKLGAYKPFVAMKREMELLAEIQASALAELQSIIH